MFTNHCNCALMFCCSENESALVPLQQQLEQIDDAIREQIALSHASRRNILQNEDKLLRLLGDL